jgi:quinone-modifying oxidoreductase subunit QmoB
LGLDKKIGIYICSGCGIGNCLDVTKLSQAASTESACIYKNHKALCSPEGFEIIKKDIEKEQLSGICVAACSPREKTELFSFRDHIQVERINIRELVAWIGEPGEENAQVAAEDYLRMGIIKLKTT